MRHMAKTITAAAFVVGLAWSGTDVAMAAGMGGGGYGGPGVAVTVLPLDPAGGEHSGSAPTASYCATPVRNCMLHNTGYVGGPCSCRDHGGRSHGHIVAQ